MSLLHNSALQFHLDRVWLFLILSKGYQTSQLKQRYHRFALIIIIQV